MLRSEVSLIVRQAGNSHLLVERRASGLHFNSSSLVRKIVYSWSQVQARQAVHRYSLVQTCIDRFTLVVGPNVRRAVISAFVRVNA